MGTYIRQNLAKNLFRFLVLTLLYSLLRWVFYRYNLSHFPQAEISCFFHGIRFDLSAIAYLNLPILLALLLPFRFVYRKTYQRITDIFFVLINSIALLASCIDIGYFPHVSKRLTADVFSYLGNAGFDFGALLPLFLTEFWWLLLILLLLIFGLVLLCRFCRMEEKTGNSNKHGALNLIGKTVLMSAGLFAVLTAMRGGWGLRPLGLVSAGEYASPQYTPLVLNTPFTLIRTIGKNTMDEFDYYPELSEAESVYNPVHRSYAAPLWNTPPVRNVVLIVLEGLSQEMFAFYHADKRDYPQYCPFLDSIASLSWAYNGIANGRRTMEGIPSIVCGIPSLMEHAYLETPFVQNRIQSPVEILAENGFHTCFFHGGKNGSMNFESYCRSIGYQDYFGMDEYPHPEDFDGHWGIPDRSYLHYMAEQLLGFREPFFATVLTLTSHHPFTLPKDAGDFNYPQGTHPMHTVSAYTDLALREFFQCLLKAPWYDSTLFIITADHAYEGSTSYTQNPYGNYRIPILFYHPSADTAFYAGHLMQQSDIMPSLFAYLQLQHPMLCFGQNVFDSAYVPTAVNYLSGIYQIYYRHYLLQYNGREVFGFYDLTADTSLKRNLKDRPIPEKKPALSRLQAILQSYSYRMNRNQMLP